MKNLEQALVGQKPLEVGRRVRCLLACGGICTTSAVPSPGDSCTTHSRSRSRSRPMVSVSIATAPYSAKCPADRRDGDGWSTWARVIARVALNSKGYFELARPERREIIAPKSHHGGNSFLFRGASCACQNSLLFKGSCRSSRASMSRAVATSPIPRRSRKRTLNCLIAWSARRLRCSGRGFRDSWPGWSRQPAPPIPPPPHTRSSRSPSSSQASPEIAEKLASDMARQSRKLGFRPTLIDMADLDLAALASARRLVVIAATWGEGEPPGRAAEFTTR